ncbi:MAG: hypothetical protein R6V67_12565 [Spirochaetia bacterium]
MKVNIDNFSRLYNLHFILAAALILLFSACVGVPDGEDKGPSAEEDAGGESDVLSLDDNVVHGKLENGLSYYVRENEKPSDRVELRLVVDAGSVSKSFFEVGLVINSGWQSHYNCWAK